MPVSFDTYAIQRTSGLNVPVESANGVATTGNGFLSPPTGTAQTSTPPATPAPDRLNAMNRPSDDQSVGVGMPASAGTSSSRAVPDTYFWSSTILPPRSL